MTYHYIFKNPIDFYIHKINSKKSLGKNFWKITYDQIMLSLQNIWDKTNTFDMLPFKKFFEQEIILKRIFIYWKHILCLI
jgi:hypothetical protein